MALDTDNLEPNSTLGHYLILSRIAHGGMGVVYKAFEARLERCVAIKVLRTEFATNPAFVLHFMEEARAVAALNHPNIVPIHYIGEESGSTFFSMAFINGETFDDWIDKGRFFSEEEAFWFMHAAISALDFAHKSHIIHLDIKPSNFLINQEQNIFLTDFGLAERLSRDRPQGDEKQGFGTPPYISPEQLWCSETDQRTDIYSLGATLYHLMVGQAPYIGDTQDEIVRGHLHLPFPDGKAIRAGVPRGWVELLRKMMEKDPEARYANYTEIYEELEKLRSFQHVSLVEYPARIIISTGVVNFKERFEQNQERTSNLLKADCAWMLSLANANEGKVFKSYKDGLFLSFKSVDKALHWAFEIQKQFEDPDQSPPDRLEHRIGIHFGPFYGQGDAVYGDPITIARKLQVEGDSGTITITSTVLDLLVDQSWVDAREIGTEYPENGETIKSFQVTRIQAPPPPPVEEKPVEEEPKIEPKPESEPELPPEPAPSQEEEAPKAKPSGSIKAFLYINGALLFILCVLALLYARSFFSEFQSLSDMLSILQKTK